MYYDAFISYRHIDEDIAVAKKLQQLLEKYKIKDPETGKIRNLHVFVDTSELASSDDLGRDIEDALDHSNYLVIIYSSTTKESKWCMEELKHFKRNHGNTNKHILPIIIEDEPHNVFPEELIYVTKDGPNGTRLVEKEPNGADIRADSLKKKLRKLSQTEHIRIVAPIIGKKFDDIYQRRKRLVRQTIFTVVAGAFVVICAFAIYNATMLAQIREKQKNIVLNESDRVADLVQNEDDNMLAITTALNTEKMIASEGITGEKLNYALRSKVIEEQIKEQRDIFHLKSTIKSNINFWLNNIYADGKKIAIYDFSNTLLYDTENGNLLFSVSSEQVFFNQDGTQCVTIERTQNYTRICWTMYDTETGEILNEYTSEEGYPYNQAFAYYDSSSDSFYLGIQDYQEGEVENITFREFTHSGESLPINDNDDRIREFKNKEFQACIAYSPHWAKNSPSQEYTAAQKKVVEEIEYFNASIESGIKIKGVYALNDRYDCYMAYDPYQTQNIYYIVDSTSSKIIKKIIGGKVYYDHFGKQLIHHDNEILKIYEINDEQADFLANRKSSTLLISDDGKRFLEHISLEDNGDGNELLLRFGEIGCKQPNEVRSYNKANSNNHLFYTNSTMNNLAYVDSNGQLIISDFNDQTLLFQEYIGFPENISAVAINEDATLAAVAVNGVVQIYQIETGLLISEADNLMSRIESLEFSDDLFMVSGSQLCLIPLEEGKYFKQNDTKKFDILCGASIGMPHFFSGDGLLFVAGNSNTPNYLSGIINLETMENCMPGDENTYRRYEYDPETSILILTHDTEHTGSSEILIYKRNNDGEFESFGVLIPNGTLHSPSFLGRNLDGNLLILHGDDSSEIYDITTQSYLFTIEADNLYLIDGYIYDSESFYGHDVWKYDLSEDMDTILDEAYNMISSGISQRTLTDNEKKKLALDGALYGDGS